MVDLGFILVTFFVFTTTMAEARLMDVVNPNDSVPDIKDEICESCVLTFLLGKENKIWYYEGNEKIGLYKNTSYDAADIRQLITTKKKQVQDHFQQDRFVLIIKPLSASAFKNLVDVIDESIISRVKRYYIDEPSQAEKEKYQ